MNRELLRSPHFHLRGKKRCPRPARDPSSPLAVGRWLPGHEAGRVCEAARWLRSAAVQPRALQSHTWISQEAGGPRRNRSAPVVGCLSRHKIDGNLHAIQLPLPPVHPTQRGQVDSDAALATDRKQGHSAEALKRAQRQEEERIMWGQRRNLSSSTRHFRVCDLKNWLAGVVPSPQLTTKSHNSLLTFKGGEQVGADQIIQDQFLSNYATPLDDLRNNAEMCNHNSKTHF